MGSSFSVIRKKLVAGLVYQKFTSLCCSLEIFSFGHLFNQKFGRTVLLVILNEKQPKNYINNKAARYVITMNAAAWLK